MLIGHEKIVADLKFLAEKGNLPHGYVFFGPAMVGKRLAALSFANFLEGGGLAEPKMLSDCLMISPSSGVIGIDAARRVKNFLWQKPAASPKRTVILDEAEKLTSEAQNALLKITEEPPPSALLILVTSDPDSIAPTIFSRLQKIYFSAVPAEAIAGLLEKEADLPEKAARDFAEKSFGKPGLALAMAKNEKFRDGLASAKKLLGLPESEKRDFIKKLMEKDDFSLSALLDYMILAISHDGFNGKKIGRWHKFLKLRRETAYFNLNPRLQLENLLS